MGKVLKPQIYAQVQVFADSRCTNVVQILNRITQPVLQHDLAPVLAFQQMIEGEYDTFEPNVVDVGHADKVRGRLRGRIVAALLAVIVKSLDLRTANTFGRTPGNAPLEVDERLVGVVCQ